MQPDDEIIETTIENDGEIAPVVIDFTQMGPNGQINESWLTMFGGAIKMIMQRMFGGGAIPITVRGNRRQVKSFARTIAGEKNYYKNYTKFGLNDPKTYRSKFQLNKSVKKFERATGIKWPFK